MNLSDRSTRIALAAPHIRNVSFDHFLQLVETDPGGAPDHRWAQLAFWRFGPEPKLAAPELGELWRLLPADTRVPDHTIWSHPESDTGKLAAWVEGGLWDDNYDKQRCAEGSNRGWLGHWKETP